MSSGIRKVVCVTGAPGYIASWLVKLLLHRGYTVRTTVRDTIVESKGGATSVASVFPGHLEVSGEKAKNLGLQVLARIRGYADAAQVKQGLSRRITVAAMVGVMLFNHSEADFAVKPGDCCTQMIIQVIATSEVAEVEVLNTTVRGEVHWRLNSKPW